MLCCWASVLVLVSDSLKNHSVSVSDSLKNHSVFIFKSQGALNFVITVINIAAVLNVRFYFIL